MPNSRNLRRAQYLDSRIGDQRRHPKLVSGQPIDPRADKPFKCFSRALYDRLDLSDGEREASVHLPDDNAEPIKESPHRVRQCLDQTLASYNAFLLDLRRPHEQIRKFLFRPPLGLKNRNTRLHQLRVSAAAHHLNNRAPNSAVLP